jgi:hypothetical protein
MGRVIAFPAVPDADLRAAEAVAAMIRPAERRQPRPELPCVVCATVGHADYRCATCGGRMHEECYYGRVLSLDEWRAHLAWLTDPANFDENDDGVPIRCPACRAKEGK